MIIFNLLIFIELSILKDEILKSFLYINAPNIVKIFLNKFIY